MTDRLHCCSIELASIAKLGHTLMPAASSASLKQVSLVMASKTCSYQTSISEPARAGLKFFSQRT